MSTDTKTARYFNKPHHITIVVRNIEKAQAFYESIGIGPWQDYGSLKQYTQLNVTDTEGFFNLKFKYIQLGTLQIQLVQPGKGKSVYKDHLEKKGEGVFHIGFEVESIKDAEQKIKESGLKVLQSGRRDDGSGFAYFQTADKAGVTLLVRQSPPSEKETEEFNI
ncbi:MAG: VOC family protein [Deltaproteobacteria bacterium]|nr:VOC family protein [Deltaproteobacteria bacterium]